MTVIADRRRATGPGLPPSPDAAGERFDGALPETLADADFGRIAAGPVYGTEPPPHDPATQTIRAGDLVEMDGMWQQLWIIEDLPAASKGELHARLADRLGEVSDGGTLWRGVPVSTSGAVRTRIAEALAGGVRAPGEIVTFIRDDGTPMVLDAAALRDIHRVVADHLAEAEAAHERVAREIEDGLVRTTAAVDYHPAWPLNA